jgi:hypothetical protein
MSNKDSKPVILIIGIGKHSFQDEMYSDLLTNLKSLATVHEATREADASAKLQSLNPTAVLITAGDFAKRSHQGIHGPVVDYAKSGGTVVFCQQFSSLISPPLFDSFFGSTWSLPWKFGNYNRTTFYLNPSRNGKLKDKVMLPKSYSMKAVHVKGAKKEDAVYVTTSSSVVQSHVFGPESAHTPDQAPVLFTSVGDGFLGYVGDVNAEEGTTSVILAMCNLG